MTSIVSTLATYAYDGGIQLLDSVSGYLSNWATRSPAQNTDNDRVSFELSDAGGSQRTDGQDRQRQDSGQLGNPAISTSRRQEQHGIGGTNIRQAPAQIYRYHTMPRHEDSKDIILLFDGTAVSFDFPYNSTISMLFEGLPRAHDFQPAFHWDGPGTSSTRPGATIVEFFDMATGYSVERKVGIPVTLRVTNYKRYYSRMVQSRGADNSYFQKLRNNPAHWKTRVFFVGVIDTVASIGPFGLTPINVYEDDTCHFRHIVSADEDRARFSPVLFNSQLRRHGLLSRIHLSVFPNKHKADIEAGIPEATEGQTTESNQPQTKQMSSLLPDWRYAPDSTLSARVDYSIVPVDNIQVCYPGVHSDLAGNSSQQSGGLAFPPLRFLVRETLAVAPEIQFTPEFLWKLGIKASTVGHNASQRPGIPLGPNDYIDPEFEVELRSEEKDIGHPVSKTSKKWRFFDLCFHLSTGSPRNYTDEPNMYRSQALLVKQHQDHNYHSRSFLVLRARKEYIIILSSACTENRFWRMRKSALVEREFAKLVPAVQSALSAFDTEHAVVPCATLVSRVAGFVRVLELEDHQDYRRRQEAYHRRECAEEQGDP
ncbi:uncharacterized protein FOMMEDRAFT_149644 [Fomitiporia mediterranea MF3/22]|uniref:T6SS Phospholipase effector Tle1-like catalytic domain-containing protein n=1 Tax=Fomitiporia mediterranea (strain MF3/22) TaxID=694068 RepID=R7SH20_FOMME|nr:uncharacterized protein FOMMEDRAFT_149644 [Fomitiporia mediterranea MF3/22]EJC97597.1 hypothetical protein FOMMEDRAFT_149644 [Fomitiporia mediterranea MF3/22]